MKIIEFNEIDSTNNYLKEHYAEYVDFTVVRSLTQTAGRGRQGKSFFSPDSGLYFSILVKDSVKLKRMDRFTAVSAVAVRRVLSEYTDSKVLIKWVNDIYINDKKVCGILCESISGAEENLAIIGIGINIRPSDVSIPEELKDKIGFLFDFLPSGLDIGSDIMLPIVNEIYNILSSVDDIYTDEYRDYSYLDGKEVYILRDNKKIPARVIGVDDRCRLVVETGSKRETLFTGDVILKDN
ncbi:MAG: biotin--[acetyl-CoA-carboxylase] ligase [Clostridiales bacterium]|nr:biotin--[acetyl-CoA-carboxylase] ligase [Clostridiales bacterium]